METAWEIFLDLVVGVVFGRFFDVWGEERRAAHRSGGRGRGVAMIEHRWDWATNTSRGAAGLGTEGRGAAYGGGGGTAWGGWWVECVPIPPPGYPLSGR